MDKENFFLPHLYESLRIEIAVNYVRQEMRKLLPDLHDESLWRIIDNQIGEWDEKLSIRNFWNAIHGISMGFRLKSLVPWITSLNMRWIEKDILIEELWFGGRFVKNVPPEIPESSAAIKKWLFLPENQEFLNQAIKDLKEKSTETMPRDDFPIFVVCKEDKFKVIDGNRRLLQAIVNKKDIIRAVVGESTAEPALYEHWVPTSLLIDLVFWHKRKTQAGRDTTEITAKIISELIRDSSAGRIEFKERAIHRDDEIHMRLLQAVEKIIKL